MKIGSININGVNAFGCTRSPGAWDFFGYFGPDVICMQETKGDAQRVKNCLGPMLDAYGYVPFVSHSLGKKGYAGVAILVKKSVLESEPYSVDRVELIDIMDENDPLRDDMKYYGTGRIIKYETSTKIIVSVYTINSGGKDSLRKRWDDLFALWVRSLDQGKSIYILGDFNVCRSELDMWNWRNALNTSPGLMDFEINAFNDFINLSGYVDTFRFLHPSDISYSWTAPKVPLSKGWRLDYALTNHIDSVADSTIVPEVRCSDHIYIEIITK